MDVHAAAEHSQMAELELVAEYAPKRINEANSGGSTSLHFGAGCNQVAAVSFLLNARANVNKTNKDGNTPLYYGRNGRVRQLLIDAGGH